ncbi:futalosine hydrolase [Desulfatiferula olefinivorans]
MKPGLDILVTVAVEAEASGLATLFSSAVRRTIGRRSFYQTTVTGRRTGVLVTGPGMINTAQAMTALIEGLRPGLIIHGGCAGYFDHSGLGPGDIGIATRETDIHTGIESDDPVRPDPLPFPLLDDLHGRPGSYNLDTDLAETALILSRGIMEPTGARAVMGPFVTVSTVTARDSRAEALVSAHAPIMESMEGAAAAHLARFYDIPFLEIRSASNRVGRRDKNAWNLPLAFERCGLCLDGLIRSFPLPGETP